MSSEYPKPISIIAAGMFMDLIDAAEAAERKMRTEYQRGRTDLAHDLESWAEGERLYHCLEDIKAFTSENMLS